MAHKSWRTRLVLETVDSSITRRHAHFISSRIEEKGLYQWYCLGVLGCYTLGKARDPDPIYAKDWVRVLRPHRTRSSSYFNWHHLWTTCRASLQEGKAAHRTAVACYMRAGRGIPKGWLSGQRTSSVLRVLGTERETGSELNLMCRPTRHSQHSFNINKIKEYQSSVQEATGIWYIVQETRSTKSSPQFYIC